MQGQIQSQGNTAQDSTKLIHENLSLVKESDRLRRELEHSNSQLANHQSVVAEKLDLQRQLDTLEVELANEKRSKRRVQEKEDHILDELRARVDETEQRLATEKKERVKMKRDHDKVLSEAQGERERVEGRVAALQTKLKGAHSELEDARSELVRCRAELERARSSTTLPKTTTNYANPGRKRPQGQQSMDQIMALTPEVERAGNQRAPKKRGIEHSILGEKSAFSVTPFLNKSRADSSGLRADSSGAENADESAQALVTDDARHESRSDNSGDDEASMKARRDVDVGSETLTQKARGRPRRAGPAALAPKRGLSAKSAALVTKKIAIPQDILDDGSAARKSQGTETTLGESLMDVPPAMMNASTTAALGDKEGKGKRRKLLGRGLNGTILDDDDGETNQRPPPLQKPQLKGVRKRTHMGTNLASTFASTSFSPLKRERRGVNASFLA